MKILFAGDFCDNGRVSPVIQNNRYNTLFESIKGTLEEYDYRVVNFEFPVVENSGKPIKKCGPVLRGQRAAIDAINSAGFNVCTLANNHILDQGPDCLINTRNLLLESGIKTVGAGANIRDASQVLYLEKGGECTGIINCCENEFSIADESTPGTYPLNPVYQYRDIQEAKKNADFVVVIIHGGVEHYTYPTKRMKDIYRFFIDAGADVVINHHQHCYCGYEEYHKKPIFYGLGNFLFDWEGKCYSEWNYGVMVGITLSKNVSTQYIIYPFEQCNDRVGVFLLEGKKHKDFLNKSEMINSIIQDENQLAIRYNQLIDKKYDEYHLLVEPYDGRILKGLFNRGALPSLLSRDKIAKLYNYIKCESHQDILISVLRDLLNKKNG